MKRFLTVFLLCLVFVCLSCSSRSPGTNTNGSTALTSSSSPADVFKANYDALKRKDVEAFKKTFSNRWIENTERMAKSDGKTLNQFLVDELMKEPESPLLPDTARANLAGDKGEVVVQDEKRSRPHVYRIVKESGAWKLDSY